MRNKNSRIISSNTKYYPALLNNTLTTCACYGMIQVQKFLIALDNTGKEKIMQKFEKGFLSARPLPPIRSRATTFIPTTGHKSSCPTPALLSRAALPATIIIGMRKIFDCWRMPG